MKPYVAEELITGKKKLQPEASSETELLGSNTIMEKVMKTPGLGLTICALAIGLAFQSAAWAYTVDASSFYIYRVGPNGFTSQSDGTATAASNIVPGASGVGSSIVTGFGPANGLSLSVSASSIQDYNVFRAQASSQLTRAFTGGNFEVLQAFATGKFVESLTIGGPAGTQGQLMLGWDVTGSSSNGTSGDTRLIINAAKSASLPNTSSQTPAINGNGHFFLSSPIAFTFGSAFNLTIDSSVFAAVGYDNTSNTGPATFSDLAAADFLHTVTLTNADVRDRAGNPITNFTITTGSGRAFLPLVAPAVPEPESYAMLMAGLGLLGFVARRRKQPTA